MDEIVEPHKLKDLKNTESGKTHSWGTSEIVDEKEGLKTIKLKIYPRRGLSYQKHQHRSEQWHIISGFGKTVIDGKEELVIRSDTVYIPSGVMHRLENIGWETLIVIEIQKGAYLDEDDIEIIADS